MASTNFIKPLKIGSFLCENNLMLAPMAGITGLPFRAMCIEGGAGLVFGEMVSAAALKYKNKKSQKLLFTGKFPTAIQVFGSDSQSISIAAKDAEKSGAVIVDINAGCPVKKIVKSGAGINLMKDEKLFAQIIESAVKSVKIPVTVKIRIGIKKGEVLSVYGERSPEFIEGRSRTMSKGEILSFSSKGENIGRSFARIAESEGASAVSVHARYASSVHSGSADLDALAKITSSVKIPVIGNGGICDAGTAKEMFKTGCAGIMIGRGAIGFPDIFNYLKAELSGKKGSELSETPSTQYKLKTFTDLLGGNADHYGEKSGLMRTKKVVGWWLKGFKGASALRAKFVLANDYDYAKTLLTNFSD